MSNIELNSIKTLTKESDQVYQSENNQNTRIKTDQEISGWNHIGYKRKNINKHKSNKSCLRLSTKLQKIRLKAPIPINTIKENNIRMHNKSVSRESYKETFSAKNLAEMAYLGSFNSIASKLQNIMHTINKGKIVNIKKDKISKPLLKSKSPLEKTSIINPIYHYDKISTHRNLSSRLTRKTIFPNIPSAKKFPEITKLQYLVSQFKVT